MKPKKTYVRPEILTEEWKIYKEVTNRSRWGHRLYEVSNLGRVKINGELVEFDDRTPCYHKIGGFKVHRAVAELFIPNPEGKPFIDHIDTNPSNNMVWNLRWVTQKENCNNPLTRQHQSESQSNPDTNKKRSQSLKSAYSNPIIKQRHKESQNTPEVRQKRKEIGTNRNWINKNGEEKWVKDDQLDLFLNKGWELGRNKFKKY